MNPKSLLLCLSLINISSYAMTETTYRELCERPGLSYQKQLICKKHKRNLAFQKASAGYGQDPVISVQQPMVVKPKHKKPSFKEQRTTIQPYIPGAYKKKETNGEDQ